MWVLQLPQMCVVLGGPTNIKALMEIMWAVPTNIMSPQNVKTTNK